MPNTPSRNKEFDASQGVFDEFSHLLRVARFPSSLLCFNILDVLSFISLNITKMTNRKRNHDAIKVTLKKTTYIAPVLDCQKRFVPSFFIHTFDLRTTIVAYLMSRWKVFELVRISTSGKELIDIKT